MADEVDLEDLLHALSPEEVAHLVDEMAADPDDKHMPASARTAYRCEKEPTGELNRDTLINYINEIALNTPDSEEKEMLEKISANDRETKDVCLNNIAGISEQQFCDIFNAVRNNDQLTKLSACNCDLSDFAVQTLCSALDQNSSLKSLSIENNRVSPNVVAELFEAAASPNNGLIEMRVASQQQEKMGLKVEERIAAAICKNPRLMKAGITLEFKEVVQRVSQQMIGNMDKMRVNRLKDGVAPGAGEKWTAARTLD